MQHYDDVAVNLEMDLPSRIFTEAKTPTILRLFVVRPVSSTVAVSKQEVLSHFTKTSLVEGVPFLVKGLARNTRSCLIG